MLDIFNLDAFSVVTLTAAINRIDHIPSRVGELCFQGVGEGVATLNVALEYINRALTLIPVTDRQAPAPQEVRDLATLKSVTIPQIKLEQDIPVSMLQNLRLFGTENVMSGPEAMIDQQLTKIAGRHDMTLEHLRLGAIQGKVVDSTGAVLLDLFNFFGVSAPENFDLTGVLGHSQTEVYNDVALRATCQQIIRFIKRNIKSPWPGSAKVWALCSDEVFDAVLSSIAVARTFEHWDKAEQMLGESYAFGVFYYGGIFWENYRGSDDNSEVAIASKKVQFLPVDVPGLYAEYYAPADFMETVNTLGLPRYAKIAPDLKFNRNFYLHTQQNPLPICTRPQILVTGSID